MYNYVIFGSNSDLYEISYADVIKMDNVRYISTPTIYRNPFDSFFYRLHWSPRINNIIKLPYKWVWNDGYFIDDFKNDRPICFIFFGRWLGGEKNSLIHYFKKKYKNSKFVCFFQDLISVRKDINIYELKSVFDLIISFDHIESKKYELEYHQLVFSKYSIKKKININYSDIYFLGKAKNRLAEIIQVYEYLSSNNLKCKFYLVGVDKNMRVYADTIKYIDKMSYEDNLQHVMSTKYLLEIMQKGGYGYTQRMCEAIAFDKKILTNNNEVLNAPFYNSRYVSVFTDIHSIDIKYLKKSMNEYVDYNYKANLSPKNLLIYIEEKLNSN